MTEEFSVLNLQQDFVEVLATGDASRWKLEKAGPLEVLVTMSSLKALEEEFQARLLWVIYPDEPPSLKFRDPQTGRLDITSAWPRVRGFRPTSFDACVNYTMEGFNLHPAWRTDPSIRWDSRGNSLLKVLRRIQAELDEFYEGRNP